MIKYSFLSKLSSLLFNQIDKLLIGIFLGPVSIGFYNILTRLPVLIKQISGIANEAILPTSSQLSAMNDLKLLN